MKTRVIFILVVLAGAIAGFSLKSNPVEKPVKKDGIFMHISSGYDNPHKVAMALTLATKFTDTHDVMLFFDIKGVEILKKGAESITMENFTSSDEALRSLLESGARIAAFPMCMKKAGISENELIEGIEVAKKELFFDFTDGRILSMDY